MTSSAFVFWSIRRAANRLRNGLARRWVRPASIVCLLCVSALVIAGQGQSHGSGAAPVIAKPDLDIRTPRVSSLGGQYPMREPSVLQRTELEQLRQGRPGLVIRWDGMSGSPRWIADITGQPLSRGDPDAAEQTARAFLLRHSGLLGLRRGEIDQLRLSSAVPAGDGGVHLYFVQEVGELEVYQGRVSLTIRSDGGVMWLASRLYAGIDPKPTPFLAAEEAARIAIRDVYPEARISIEARTESTEARAGRLTLFRDDESGYSTGTRLIWFPEKDAARLAWEVRVAEPTLRTDYLVLVDARDGTLLARHNLTSYASARVLLANLPDPESEEYAPEQHQVVALPGSTPESPDGWLEGDGTALTGNNAVSSLGHAEGAPIVDDAGVFDYDFNTDKSALVNAWYWVNEAHERFYALGFDEQAGNFQQSNRGLGGFEGDAVEVATDPSVGLPFFTATIDGEAPTLSFGWMHESRFCADHDGYPENGGDRSYGFMRDLMIHEYTHGMTGRRVGGPGDSTCLVGGIQPRRMAEGWSDLFAGSFFDSPRVGEYLGVGRGWRSDPRHDLTYGDFHDPYIWGNPPLGLIWYGILWDLRQSMLALDPAGGLDEFHQLILESLAILPCNPTMVDGRDAVLAADTLLYMSSHHPAIWSVFAARGIGQAASTTGPDDHNQIVDYSVPAGFECLTPPVPTGLTANAEGQRAIRLSYEAPDAASIEIWREDPDNPADAFERLAFTLDTSSFVDETVEGGRSYRYAVVALGGGGVDCRSAESNSVTAMATGDCNETYPLFIPNVVVTDGDPSCAIRLEWDPGTAACPGSGDPIVYNVYRYGLPGYQPSDRLLVGRTTSPSYVDIPIESEEGVQPYFNNGTPYYLVLAQHGTLDDSPDHRDRGPRQVMQWAPGLATLGRSTVHSWDFDTGDQGWTAWAASGLPTRVHWKRVVPSPSVYGGTLLAPDEAAGGIGAAWVTGDPEGEPSTFMSHTCAEGTTLTSPAWDGRSGATILSFDYWAHPPWGTDFFSYLHLSVPGSASTIDLGMLTTQRFLGPGRFGWQRAEIDLSRFAIPTEAMEVVFASQNCEGNGEYAIDNVRIERATRCSVSALRLNNVSVDDSPPGWGNGNLVLEPGEIARVEVEILNEGSSATGGAIGQMTSRIPGVLMLDDSSDYPSIGPSQTVGPLDGGFTVALPADSPCDGTVVFELAFTDLSGGRSTAIWSPEWGETVTEVLLEDDFETNKGWVVSGAGPTQGIWERGDPVGTYDGSWPANPEEDSPYDENAQCYVTENGPIGGPADTHDVDPGSDAVLQSPPLTVSGVKRLHIGFDLWEYLVGDDLVLVEARDDTGNPLWSSWPFGTNAWIPQSETIPLSQSSPVERTIRLAFTVSDGLTDNIKEVGVDNIRIEADRQVCISSGVNPPNAVGSTLRLAKSPSSVVLHWAEPPSDATHDPAVFYKVFVSNSPDGGFVLKETPVDTQAERPLSGTEFYMVAATNGGGTSGEVVP